MNILSTICARGGSKGVKNKNIRELNGKILAKWGKASKIVCSTDSKDIARIANDYGAETPFMRPEELASDNAAKIPVIQHALEFCEKEYNTEYDLVIDLDPTAPLRKINDLDNALAEFHKTQADVLYSVKKKKKNPYFNMVELDDEGNARISKKLESAFVRRQDAPQVYSINGSIYIYDRNHLISVKGLHCENERIYVMDDIAAIDIDREIDFKFIEFLLKSGEFKFD